MPKARKRATPVTSLAAPGLTVATGTGPAASKTRTVIRRFHVLLKRQAHLSQSASASAAARGDGDAARDITNVREEKRKELEEVEQEIAALGGLPAYQRMSIAGQSTPRGGGAEKVLVEWLRELGLDRKCGNEKGKEGESLKLRVLEVGALKPDNFAACAGWMAVTPIDLYAQHPGIRQQDFLALDVDAHRARWDVISLSLVVNFVPGAKDRGKMLRLAHTFLRPGGHLFLALPLPCVSNSRYLTFEHLRVLMKAIGLAELKERWKPGGKMAYWLYRRDEPGAKVPDAALGKKTVLRTGNRNNFCILL